MLTKIKTLIEHKRVLILGFGKEGQSTFRVLKNIGGYLKLDIADMEKPKIQIDNEHEWIGSKDHIDSLELYDIVFKSPGIELPQKPEKYSCLITSQTDIFLDGYGKQTIGITGTKGKSTVTSLIYHVLKSVGKDTFLAGNIGVPVFDTIERISPDTIIVLELSCHQLEHCSYSPSVALLLNIYEDHLDRYKTLEVYRRSKSSIYRHQEADDIFICNPQCLPKQSDINAKTILINIESLPPDYYKSIADIPLRGINGQMNCSFAYQACKLHSVNDSDFISALKTFQTLPHRLELFTSQNGVDYYDDSISTTAESTIYAVESVSNVATLILGGMDRGIDYTALVDFISESKLKCVILMYASGKRIYDMIKEKNHNNANKINAIFAENLTEAVEAAKKQTPPGSACILSPASASYDNFKNFEDRGETFKRLVLGL